MAKPAIIIGDGKFATKDTKFLAHAQGDSSSRFVARELTYDRGSNLTATRVASNGLIEKGRENLLHYSNNFSTTSGGGGWGHIRISSLSTGQDGYDGTTNASAIFSAANSGKHQVVIGTANSLPGEDFSITGVFTLSVHAKPNGYDHLILRSDRTNVNASFNIATGVVGTKGSECIESSMTAVGNGFYRCEATFAPGAATTFLAIGMMEADDTTDFTGSTSKGYILQDAQIEVGLVATSLISTSGAAGKAGILEDQTRVDYLSNSNGYLLLEPTRQNKFAQSEYLTGVFNSIRATFNHNSATSPEGVKNAVFVAETSATSDTHGFQFIDFPIVDGTFYSISFFVKANGREKFFFQCNDESVLAMNVTVDLSGTPSAVDSRTGHTGSEEIINYGDGWYRVEINGKEGLTTNSDKNLNFFFIEDASGTNTSYDGDTSKGLLFYGLQVEEGHFCTSYIPTHGTAASRSAEGLPASTGSVIDMSSFMKGDDVTLVVELAENSSAVRDASNASIRISNGNSQNGSINIYRASASATTYRAVFFGTSADSFSSGVSSGAVIIDGSAPKIAISRARGASTSTFTIYVNGSALANSDGLTDGNGQFSNTNFDVTMDDLQITGMGSVLKISKLKLFDRALTNSGDNNEMASETS